METRTLPHKDTGWGWKYSSLRIIPKSDMERKQVGVQQWGTSEKDKPSLRKQSHVADQGQGDGRWSVIQGQAHCP